jgi:hypothetical protein
MKTTHKKMVGGLLIGLLIATIGAVAVTGQTDDTTDDLTPPEHLFGGTHGMMGCGMFGYSLTDEQSSELEELMISLREQNATSDEMRSAIQEKLDEFGVLDAQLDNEIARTEERLTILNREKELRDEGYSWNEITSIIEEEFGLENTIDFAMDLRGGRGGPGHEPRGCPPEFVIPEDLEQ